MRFDQQTKAVSESRAERLLRPERRWVPLLGRWLINLLVALLCIAVPVAGYWVWNDYRTMPSGSLGGTDLAANAGGSGTETSGLGTPAIDSGDQRGSSQDPVVNSRLTPSQASCARGHALIESGDPGRSIEHFKDAIRINPEFAQAHYGLALAYIMTHDLESARAQREILTRLDANLVRLLDNLLN